MSTGPVRKLALTRLDWARTDGQHAGWPLWPGVGQVRAVVVTGLPGRAIG